MSNPCISKQEAKVTGSIPPYWISLTEEDVRPTIAFFAPKASFFTVGRSKISGEYKCFDIEKQFYDELKLTYGEYNKKGSLSKHIYDKQQEIDNIFKFKKDDCYKEINGVGDMYTLPLISSRNKGKNATDIRTEYPPSLKPPINVKIKKDVLEADETPRSTFITQFFEDTTEEYPQTIEVEDEIPVVTSIIEDTTEEYDEDILMPELICIHCEHVSCLCGNHITL